MAARLRYVTFGVLGLSAVLGLVMAHGLQWLAQNLEWRNPALFGSRELTASAVLGYALAAAAGAAVLWGERSRNWAGEVVDELMRVSWPSREETTHATVVVMVCVVVCAGFLGVFDAAWLWLSGLIVGN